MRIVINETKKIWNIRTVLILILLCALFYWLCMDFHIKYFPNAHPNTEEFEFSVELLCRYGTTLEESEFLEFTSITREELINESEIYIKTMPVFKEAGIYSYEDYGKLSEKEYSTEVETKAVRTLLGEECNYVQYKLQALESIEEWYNYFPHMLDNLLKDASYEREIKRLTAVKEKKEYRNIMYRYAYENTVEYSIYLAILSVMAVLVMVSPLIVSDRTRNIHLLQYSSKLGRRILNSQLVSVILSSFILTTFIIIFFGIIYSTTGTLVFWNSGMTSFLNHQIFLIDFTFGQYILIYIISLYILCLGTAALSFIVSRYSRNLITLILKLIPVFAVISVLCIHAFKYILSPMNLLYRRTGILGIELSACILVFVIGFVLSIYAVLREKKINVV